MKKLHFILMIGSMALLYSCSDGQAGTDTQGAKAASPGAAASSPAPATAGGKATADGDLFSATIDGQTYGSSTSFSLYNSADNQVDDHNQPYLVLTLGDVKSEDDTKVTRTFRLVVAKKTGAVHLTRAEEIPNYGIDLDFLDGTFGKYRPEDVNLSVTGLTEDRVKGNFSGKMYHVDPVPEGSKKSVMVDVKFDIPIIR